MWRDGRAMGGGVSVGCFPWGLGSRCVTEGSSLGVASPSLPPDGCPCVPPAVPFPRRGAGRAGMLPGTREQGVQSPGVAQERVSMPRDLFRVFSPLLCVPRRDVLSVPFPPCPGGRAGAERGGRFWGCLRAWLSPGFLQAPRPQHPHPTSPWLLSASRPLCSGAGGRSRAAA